MAAENTIELGREIERSIEGLWGIRAARVQESADGINSIRVLVMPERTAQETVRDVRTLVASRFATELGPTEVEVLGTASDGAAHNSRRKLTSLTTERYGDRFIARVALELEGDVLIGESDSPIGRYFELRATGRATLGALEGLLASAVELDNVTVVDVGENRFCMVALSYRDGLLSGSAPVRRDEPDAVARAVLNGLNRLITQARENGSNRSIVL
jgi:hypothetical protein